MQSTVAGPLVSSFTLAILETPVVRDVCNCLYKSVNVHGAAGYKNRRLFFFAAGSSFIKFYFGE